MFPLLWHNKQTLIVSSPQRGDVSIATLAFVQLSRSSPQRGDVSEYRKLNTEIEKSSPQRGDVSIDS